MKDNHYRLIVSINFKYGQMFVRFSRGSFEKLLTGEHQWGIHPSLGKHTLHIVDHQGRALTHDFEIISDHG